MHDTQTHSRPGQVDWVLVLAVLGLMLVGTAFIFSAKSGNENVAWYNQFYVRQIFWYGIGSIAAFIIAILDYRLICRFAIPIYWCAIGLLVVVLLFGATRMGAQRWIDLGFFQLQPSEFAKIAVILLLAHLLSRPAPERRTLSLFMKAVVLAALPFALILKQPDLGSSLVLIPITFAMVYIGGVPSRYLIRSVTVAALLVAFMVGNILFAPESWRIPLEDYQRHRLLVFFNRDFASRDATPEEQRRARELQRQRSYQVRQAMISVGSGGLTGLGWRQGQQIALGYLPPGASHNDFIFSVIAEEKGFLGSVVVLGLFSVVLLSGLRIATQARDPMGRLLAVGIVALWFSHVFINIGMNIRLMPVTGIPLPLLSYGGSSVFCSLIAAGLLQNVQLHQRKSSYD